MLPSKHLHKPIKQKMWKGVTCASLFAKDWTGLLVIHCIVHCDALTIQRFNGDEAVGCENTMLSPARLRFGACLAVGLLC